jgi:hypothetical protein
VYYIVAASGKTVFVRYMVPLVPFLAIFAAIAIHRLSAKWHPSTVALISIFVALPSLSSDVQCNRLLSRKDTRLAAADWIRSHVPSGSRIAMEGSHFGYPQAQRSREWLLDELDSYKAVGLDGRRVLRMLEIEDYPPNPNYYVFEMRPLVSCPRSSFTILFGHRRLPLGRREPNAPRSTKAGAGVVRVRAGATDLDHPFSFFATHFGETSRNRSYGR